MVYQKVDADGFNREEFFNLYANQLTVTRPPVHLDEREQYLLLREKFKDETLIADLTASYDFGGVELTSVTSYINRDILVQPRRLGADRIGVGRSRPSPMQACCIPSNLRDTTDLKTLTQELRLSSTGDGPFQWVVGGFYSDIERIYPAPANPGLRRASSDCCSAAPEPSAARRRAMASPANSPYNADLPYDIKQKAVFGEASYDFGQFKLTAGAALL